MSFLKWISRVAVVITTALSLWRLWKVWQQQRSESDVSTDLSASSSV